MPEPDRPPATVVPLVGQRIVADPASIDAMVAAIPARATVIRFAPDEVLILDGGLGGLGGLGDDAIVEDDVGFVAVTVDGAVVARHTEWTLPDRGGIAHGAIAGVPAKLAWLPDGRAWIVTQAAYLADLLDRLT